MRNGFGAGRGDLPRRYEAAAGGKDFFLDNSKRYWYFYQLAAFQPEVEEDSETMYAVIQTGGKQYKVSPGDIVRVEQLAAKPGETVELTDVFLIADGDKVSIGKPALSSAKVTAEVVREDRGEKLLIFKHRRRKNFRKTIGHRQDFTELRIKDIKA